MTTPQEFFTADGHLSDFALQELISGCPEELTRLEIAEHLSFCDACTERYTALLCEECLLEPQQPLAPTVMQRIRQRARVVFLNRYVAAGVAACFTMTLWFGGAFGAKLPIQDSSAFERLTVLSETLTEKTAELGSSFAQGINSFFQQIDLRGAQNNEKK